MEWLVDLSNLENAEKELKSQLIEACRKGYGKITLINNAATLGSIQAIKNYQVASTLAGIQLNLAAPMLLSAWVLEATADSPGLLHIFNISSGAAKRALPAWGLYCSTKAGLDMLSSALALENPKAKIASVNPGIMDTPMQEHIRSANENDFPLVGHFRQYKREQLLVPPSTIAELLVQADKNGDFESGEVVQLEARFNAPRNNK
jgi:short-subunit dehydrogenase